MNKQKRVRIKSYVIIIMVLLCSLFFMSCSKINEKKGSIYCFNTIIDISLYGKDIEQLDNVYQEVLNIYNKYNKYSDCFKQYNDLSNIYTINNNFTDDYILCDDELVEMLKYTIDIQKYSLGHFNILIGNLSKKYKVFLETQDQSDYLSVDVINNELEIMNNSHIIIDENKVKIDGNASIDLGGVAKGYATKVVKEYLDKTGITSYLINAGNSTVLLGLKSDNKDNRFKVGIKNKNDIIYFMKNTTLSTSSILEQKFVYKEDGKTYTHIINPITGLNDTLYDTVSIVLNDSCLGDVLSTSFLTMTIEEILESLTLLQKDNIDIGIVLFNGQKIVFERGMEEYE